MSYLSEAQTNLEFKQIWSVPKIRLTRSLKNPPEYDPTLVLHTGNVGEVFLRNWNTDIRVIERAMVLYLSANNSPIALFESGAGTMNSLLLDFRLVMIGSLLINSTAFVICHNHPSSRLEFSNRDLDVLETFKEKSEIMGISMHDFIIITPEGRTLSAAAIGKL